jgi:hypothetical protein
MSDTTFTYDGAVIQTFTATATGTYDITVFGAQGGSATALQAGAGGMGAEIGGAFSLATGEVLDIVVGGAGGTGTRDGGGGGGSFVIETYTGTGGAGVRTPLVIAGGGGSYAFAGDGGHVGGAGGYGTGTDAGAGGTAGSGGGGAGVGFVGGGGGGYSGGDAGANGRGYGSGYSGGLALDGLRGGGGFGGGGGGGYSGGGGGSLDNGTNQELVAAENSGNGLVEIEPPCYLRGTHIATLDGETRIEHLAAGDLVQARDVGTTPIKWIGYCRVDCRNHPYPQRVWPVRVRNGAFGEGVPHRDL